MRLGIFGGSFDPVHYSHLLLAECCREQRQLDHVWFVAAATPPHKQHLAQATAKQRVEMLELAIGGHEAFAVSRIELDRGGVSYTVDTLREVRRQQPADELFLLMGADALRDLPTWKDPAEICQLATLVVVRRAGLPELDFSHLAEFVDATRLAQFAASQVQMPLVDFSSTDLRQRAAAGLSLRYRTPRAVEKYIQTQRLYQAGQETA
jgi:nicotinate-nucleotide adenylyltransferase